MNILILAALSMGAAAPVSAGEKSVAELKLLKAVPVPAHALSITFQHGRIVGYQFDQIDPDTGKAQATTQGPDGAEQPGQPTCEVSVHPAGSKAWTISPKSARSLKVNYVGMAPGSVWRTFDIDTQGPNSIEEISCTGAAGGPTDADIRGALGGYFAVPPLNQVLACVDDGTDDKVVWTEAGILEIVDSKGVPATCVQ